MSAIEARPATRGVQPRIEHDQVGVDTAEPVDQLQQLARGFDRRADPPKRENVSPMLEQKPKGALERRAARVVRVDGEDRGDRYPGMGRLELSGAEVGVFELDQNDRLSRA